MKKIKFTLILLGILLFNSLSAQNLIEWFDHECVYDTTVISDWEVLDTLGFDPTADTTWLYSDWLSGDGDMYGDLEWGSPMCNNKEKHQKRANAQGIIQKRIYTDIYRVHNFFEPAPPLDPLTPYEKLENELGERRYAEFETQHGGWVIVTDTILSHDSFLVMDIEGDVSWGNQPEESKFSDKNFNLYIEECLNDTLECTKFVEDDEVWYIAQDDLLYQVFHEGEFERGDYRFSHKWVESLIPDTVIFYYWVKEPTLRGFYEWLKMK